MGTQYGKKYDYDLKVFYKEDDISFYLLGVFMTDGCIKSNDHSIILGSKDLEWLCEIKNLICPEIKIYLDNGSYKFGIYSKELKLWFISKGCTPKKSLTLKFPEVPEKYLPDFIRGCIDGDGSLGKYKHQNKKESKNKITILTSYLCGSSLQFLETYHSILENHEIKSNLQDSYQKKIAVINGKIITRNSDHWRVSTKNKHTQKLLSWIYYPGHKISLERKNIIAQQIISTKINYVGIQPNLVKRNSAKMLRAQGHTLKEIAQQLNTSISRVSIWLKLP